MVRRCSGRRRLSAHTHWRWRSVKGTGGGDGASHTPHGMGRRGWSIPAVRGNQPGAMLDTLFMSGVRCLLNNRRHKKCKYES